jgi:hypothetical protein
MTLTLSIFGRPLRLASLAVLALALHACSQRGGSPPPPPAAAGPTRAERTHQAAVDAYVYGYPLVTMEMTRRVLTNVAKPEGKAAPMAQIAKLRAYPTPQDKEVTAPNADTLYTMAWLDLSKEPWVFGIPDMKGRYYLMPMLSGWTDVFEVPGKRTTGTKAQKYLIAGPGWGGTVPNGVTELKSPTNLVWILGRIYSTGTPADYKAVHILQDRVTLVPLSAYGQSYQPPEGVVDPAIDMKTPVREQVNGMDAASYFALLATLMKDNPPAAADAPMVAEMATIGLVPGDPFDPAKLGPDFAKDLDRVPPEANAKIMAALKDLGPPHNGWSYSTHLGTYGTNYLVRAVTTAVGLGANRAQDAVYPVSEADADGKPYDGASRYVMHFDKGQMPPVEGFWSLTMYDEHYFFVPNPLDRYTLSARNALKRNKDGSVDLYIQHESPGRERESNWLPAPAGRFVLMLRLYWPAEKDPSILDDSWPIPPVTQVQ